jgi:riboflavin biosynthesis pyrimidine reductase
VDEWFVTTGAVAIGGRGPRLTTVEDEFERRFALAHLLHDAGDLYARYVRVRT